MVVLKLTSAYSSHPSMLLMKSATCSTDQSSMEAAAEGEALLGDRSRAAEDEAVEEAVGECCDGGGETDTVEEVAATAAEAICSWRALRKEAWYTSHG